MKYKFINVKVINDDELIVDDKHLFLCPCERAVETATAIQYVLEILRGYMSVERKVKCPTCKDNTFIEDVTREQWEAMVVKAKEENEAWRKNLKWSKVVNAEKN